MGEDEELLGKKPKKERPPYLGPLKEALATKTRVLYQGRHRDIADLRRQYIEKKSATGAASGGKGANFKDKKTGQYVRFTVDQLLGLRDVYNRVLRKSDYGKLETPAELGRFMMVLEKAGSMNPFFRDLYTTTSPRLSVNLSSTVKNFQEIVCFLLPMREPEEVSDLITHMLNVEKRRKQGDGSNKTEEEIAQEEKKNAMKARLRGAARNKAMVLSKVDELYVREDEGIVKQRITLEKRLELERLFTLCSQDGKRVFEEDWMDYFDDTLNDAGALKQLFAKHAVHSDLSQKGKKFLKFEEFARILLPLTFQLCDRPAPGKSHLTEEELWKKFHSNAVVDEKSTVWADVQTDIKRMQDVSEEDDEKTRLLKIASKALEKYKIEDPVDVYKFGDFDQKKKGGKK
ncbi:unnamed protein product [Amoebophrya sp. A120]|nr:unnamed protein product [Amoebophrya sp. A120]|eukprot:GSA120T00021645001.1